MEKGIGRQGGGGRADLVPEGQKGWWKKAENGGGEKVGQRRSDLKMNMWGERSETADEEETFQEKKGKAKPSLGIGGHFTGKKNRKERKAGIWGGGKNVGEKT